MEKANIPAAKPAFHAVDEASDPARLVSYLTTFAALPSVKSMKKKATKRLALRENSFVVDLGCGVGDDALAFSRLVAKGMVVGIDTSSLMITEAEKRRRYTRENLKSRSRLPFVLY